MFSRPPLWGLGCENFNYKKLLFMLVSCDSPFSEIAWVNCTDNPQLSDTVDSTKYYLSCDENFVITSSYIRNNGVCNSSLGLDDLSSNQVLFEIDSYSNISGYFNSPVGLTNTLVSDYQNTVPTNPDEYQLNRDLMEVLFVESFYIFGFGILFGAIISMIRKTGHK